MCQIGPKWDKCGTFSDLISVHFGAGRQNVLKSNMKSPGFVPFWADLTYFGVKCYIPADTGDIHGSLFGPKRNILALNRDRLCDN